MHSLRETYVTFKPLTLRHRELCQTTTGLYSTAAIKASRTGEAGLSRMLGRLPKFSKLRKSLTTTSLNWWRGSAMLY